MEMHQIRYFLAVSDTLNFTRAAEVCYVAQPSLSRAIQKLEAELGGALFRRERSQTHLTELGRTMLPLLRQCYESAVAAKEQAGGYRKAETAPLRIGLSQTIGLDRVTLALRELARAFPGLVLHLKRGTAEEMLDALKAGELELVVAACAPPDWDRFDVWALYDEGFVMIAAPGHPLSERDSVSVADIAAGSLVARPYCESAGAFADRLEAAGIAPRLHHEAASDGDALALVESGFGFTIMPTTASRPGSAQAVPIADLGLSRTVRAIGVAGRQRSAAATGLVRLLRAADWSTVAD